MSRQTEERRVRGIARQIGLLKCEIRKESKKNTFYFLSGLMIGMLANVLLKLLS